MRIIFLSVLVFCFNCFADYPVLIFKGIIKIQRGAQQINYQKNTPLLANDIIQTDGDSHITVQIRELTFSIGAHSSFRIIDAENAKEIHLVSLLYGHALGTLSKNIKDKYYRIGMYYSSVKFTSSQFLLSVTRSFDEYLKHQQDIYSPIPTLKEMARFDLRKKLFSQIACIEGSIMAYGKNKDPMVLHTGDLIRFDLGIPTLKGPLSVGAHSILASSVKLGIVRP